MDSPDKPLILCVDDNRVSLILMERLLVVEGYHVITAKNGPEALAKILEAKPNLVVLDIMMPGIDGYDVCIQMQKTRAFAEVPVLFVTGCKEEVDRAKALAVGAVDCMPKPIQKERFIQKVRSCLGSQSRPRQRVSKSTSSPQGIWNADFNGFKDFLALQLKLPPNQHHILSVTPPTEVYSLTSTLGIGQSQLAKLIAEYLGIPHLTILNPIHVRSGKLPVPFCRTNLVVSFNREGGGEDFVLSNPFNLELLSVLNKFKGMDQDCQFYITEPDNILGAFKEKKAIRQDDSKDPDASVPRGKGTSFNLREGQISESEKLPVIKLADSIVEKAVTQRASDIHLEPKATQTVVRFRIDGEMQEMFTMKKKLGAQVISRFKALAGLDIAERRRPQDGAVESTINGRTFKMRLATTSTPDGECLIIRLLEPEARVKMLQELGMNEEQTRILEGLATRDHGLILIVGPTGSGKTTTIYSVLGNIDCQTRSLISVEDPVEYRIPFANQQQVNEKAGITYESLLRSVMRQDPDIMYQGEVRDNYSAKMAMDFASTGHLTITSMHTANATTAIFRLERLGISRAIMADSIICVVAQRLIKKLCIHCKKNLPITSEEKEWLSPFTSDLPSHVAHPVGCSKCNQTGYSGREGIYETILFDAEVTQLIYSGRPIAEIREVIRKRGDTLISHHAVEKVKNLVFPPKDVYAKVLVEEAKIDQDVSQEVKAKEPVIEELSEDQPAPAKLQIVRSGKLKAKAATDDDHKFSVLIVEDDKVTRMVTQRILEKNDYMTTIAEDGIDALLQLGRADFDLILSDINMPNLDGFKLLEMMGQKGIACPVILMTGSTSDETEIRGFELGAFDYIKKPIQKDVLLKRIKNVLAKSSDKKFKTA